MGLCFLKFETADHLNAHSGLTISAEIFALIMLYAYKVYEPGSSTTIKLLLRRTLQRSVILICHPGLKIA